MPVPSRSFINRNNFYLREGTSMSITRLFQKILCSICVGTAFLAAMNFAVGIPMVRMALAAKGGQDGKGHDHHGKGGGNDQNTNTPIQHVIVIIGENRTFDHIFATYQPRHGE